MKSTWKIGVVLALAAAVVVTFALRADKRARDASTPSAPPAAAAPAPAAAPPSPPAPAAVAAARQPAVAPPPRLLELGSMRCQACLEMAKVLDALRASQGARLQVDFIDVFERPEAVERYRVGLIPTQILFDGSGKEIFRHQGYFSHDDILAKFRELGVAL